LFIPGHNINNMHITSQSSRNVAGFAYRKLSSSYPQLSSIGNTQSILLRGNTRETLRITVVCVPSAVNTYPWYCGCYSSPHPREPP